MSLLHEQYDIDGDLVLFECDECGLHFSTNKALGRHAAKKHQ